MKTDGTGRRTMPGRLLCLLTAVLLLACMQPGAADDGRFDFDPDVILARDAAQRLDLREPDGSPLDVRIDASIPGRGQAEADGTEPDYTGLIGFAALPNDPEISKLSVFDKGYWTVPLYRLTEDGPIQDGTIAHKSPLVITGQDLAEAGDGTYTGYLEAVRLDTGEQCMIEAKCFVTLPYWTLDLTEIPAYGYSIAVYRETAGEAPKDAGGNSCMLRDGTRVLIPFDGACPDENPEPEILQVQGVVFREEAEGNTEPLTVYFRIADLKLKY